MSNKIVLSVAFVMLVVFWSWVNWLVWSNS